MPQIQGHIQTRPKTFLDVTVSLGGSGAGLPSGLRKKVTNTSALAAEVVLR